MFLGGLSEKIGVFTDMILINGGTEFSNFMLSNNSFKLLHSILNELSFIKLIILQDFNKFRFCI